MEIQPCKEEHDLYVDSRSASLNSSLDFLGCLLLSGIRVRVKDV